MKSDNRVKAKKTLSQPSAARLARAEAEDRMDKEWLEQCLRAWSKYAKGRGLTGFEAFMAATDAPVPPQPPGFRRRQEYCNRCGQRTEMNHDYDAHYCGRCNRWIDSTCRDPHCVYCSKRPERPMP
jgi:ribosomal protein S27AE